MRRLFACARNKRERLRRVVNCHWRRIYDHDERQRFVFHRHRQGNRNSNRQYCSHRSRIEHRANGLLRAGVKFSARHPWFI
ncbi:MAG: hypothetical protein LBR07_02165 [Puniceicoccales bacterium]|nr:hypothetical protein [Puniceicoccales bacterium]